MPRRSRIGAKRVDQRLVAVGRITQSNCLWRLVSRRSQKAALTAAARSREQDDSARLVIDLHVPGDNIFADLEADPENALDV